MSKFEQQRVCHSTVLTARGHTPTHLCARSACPLPCSFPESVALHTWQAACTSACMPHRRRGDRVVGWGAVAVVDARGTHMPNLSGRAEAVLKCPPASVSPANQTSGCTEFFEGRWAGGGGALGVGAAAMAAGGWAGWLSAAAGRGGGVACQCRAQRALAA